MGWILTFREGLPEPECCEWSCRSYDCLEDGCCNDTTFEEIVEQMASWHDRQAKLLRTGEHPTVRYYKEQDDGI